MLYRVIILSDDDHDDHDDDDDDDDHDRDDQESSDTNWEFLHFSSIRSMP